MHANSSPRRINEIFLLSDLPRMRPYIVRLLRSLDGMETRRSELQRIRALLGSDRSPARQRERRLLDIDFEAYDREKRRLDDECQAIGVKVGRPGVGELLFPTVVDDRPAFFVWKSDDLLPIVWRFEDADDDRFIPERWYVLSSAGAVEAAT